MPSISNLNRYLAYLTMAFELPSTDATSGMTFTPKFMLKDEDTNINNIE